MNSPAPNELCKQEMNSERSTQDLGGLFLLFFNQHHCAGMGEAYCPCSEV